MAKVLKPFRDRLTWAAYEVGDEYEGDRAGELAGLGYVESVAEKPAPRKRATRKAAPKE